MQPVQSPLSTSQTQYTTAHRHPGALPAQHALQTQPAALLVWPPNRLQDNHELGGAVSICQPGIQGRAQGSRALRCLQRQQVTRDPSTRVGCGQDRHAICRWCPCRRRRHRRRTLERTSCSSAASACRTIAARRSTYSRSGGMAACGRREQSSTRNERHAPNEEAVSNDQAVLNADKSCGAPASAELPTAATAPARRSGR